MTDDKSNSSSGKAGGDKPTVFISYSHKDEVWKDRLRPHLVVLEQVGHITVWDDRSIDVGATWFPEIERVIAEAAVTVCLVSADYLASDFVAKEEVPVLLVRRARDGMTLIPVLLRPCPWKAVPWLSAIQMVPRDSKSVAVDFKDDWDTVFSEVAEHIYEILEDPDYQPPAPPPPQWSSPEMVDIDRLPATGAELFGRQKEMVLLDDAWGSDGTNVISLVAWGGVGKSTLVNKWLDRMAANNYRGARRVFGWSFYSQGTGERVTSADLFIAEALQWFGDEDPTLGSPWDKGQRLAELVRKQSTLLMLDGMEPLQSDLEFDRGAIKDPALATLVAELARENQGLCVITTREKVADLVPFRETTSEKDLEQISAEAGRALLRVGGVRGADAELEAATRDFGNHALALNLLTAYLHDIPGHHISHAAEIPDLDIPDEAGRHPRRVMAAIAQRFGDGPEVELLRVLGLFDRPAEADAIAAVRAAPAMPNLTEHIFSLTEADWLRLLEKLRRIGLVAAESDHRPDVLDAHPLVREHFGQQLIEEHAQAWREGNNRLYEHYKAAAPEFPDTLEEMAPLFAAVVHGCAAGRHQEALEEVYWRRLSRGNEFYVTKKLGAFGADLAVLSRFFEPPWRRPVAGITEAYKSHVLGQVGFRLRALGRLAEAVEPFQAGLDADIAREDWKNAAISAGNLSELYLTMGDISQALAYAEKGVELADRSGEASDRMNNRATLADSLHQAGRAAEAEELFREAQEMQEELQPQYPLLYSLRGFQYCDLLLDQGMHQEVLDRARRTIEWVEKAQISLLDIALDHLSLGRAHLAEAQQEGTGDSSKAAEHLDHAVNGLRQAGQQQELPRDFERARRDLDEAKSIAERGGMRLHQADANLAYARLHLAMGDKPKAREHLDKAKEMVERMRYHRRDGEVAELEAAVKE